jgi:hypothetical protein
LFRAQRGKSFGPKAQQLTQRRAQPWNIGRTPSLICRVLPRPAQRANSSPYRIPSKSTNNTRGTEDQLLARWAEGCQGQRTIRGGRCSRAAPFAGRADAPSGLASAASTPQSRHKNRISRDHIIRRLLRRPSRGGTKSTSRQAGRGLAHTLEENHAPAAKIR